MPVRQILALKRAAIQSRIDRLGAGETELTRRIDQLQAQGDGLNLESDMARFQVAALAGETARSICLRLERDRDTLRLERLALVRERLGLDVAYAKLEAAEVADRRLTQSRAEDRA